MVPDLLDRVQANPLPPCSSDIHVLLANQFLDHFSDKIEKICLEPHVDSDQNLQSFPSKYADHVKSASVGTYMYLDAFTSMSEGDESKNFESNKR